MNEIQNHRTFRTHGHEEKEKIKESLNKSIKVEREVRIAAQASRDWHRFSAQEIVIAPQIDT